MWCVPGDQTMVQYPFLKLTIIIEVIFIVMFCKRINQTTSFTFHRDSKWAKPQTSGNIITPNIGPFNDFRFVMLSLN